MHSRANLVDLAFQAIVTIAHLKEGETILIHTGASGRYQIHNLNAAHVTSEIGVGTAALQLAKLLKAYVRHNDQHLKLMNHVFQ
jgi:NADPH:quinone reductase-like Zn-dependent oxidoreductase